MELPYCTGWSENAEYAMKILKSKAYKATHGGFDKWLDASGLELTNRERIWLRQHQRIHGREHGSVVYFFICKSLNAVKIGTTGNVEQRLATVQTSCPEKVKLLGFFRGGLPEEKKLHRVLRMSLIRGEWFRLDDHVKQVITEVTDGRIRFDG